MPTKGLCELGQSGRQILDAPERISQLKARVVVTACDGWRLVGWSESGGRRRVAARGCLRVLDCVSESVNAGLDTVIRPAVQES